MTKTSGKQQSGMDEQQGDQRAGGASRKRGARPGNTNAWKHGFYSRRFTRREIDREDGQPAQVDVRDEINLLRVLIWRAFNKLDRHSPTYPKDLLKLVEMCSKGIASLRYAAQTQRLPGQKGGDPAAEFNEIVKRKMNAGRSSQ